MQKEQLPMAVEGYPFILFSGFTTLILALLGYSLPTLAGLLATGFICWFFRDPARILPTTAGAVVCPADGKVIKVEEVDDDRFLKQRAIKVCIFMNVFNVHVNRIPLAGTVEGILFKPGRFYSADKDSAELHNEYCALIMTTGTNSDTKYALVQIAGLIARRIVCRAEPGDRVAAGERFGLIRFGSRVDLYLPLETRVTAAVGDRVKAGETTLGILP